MPNWLLNKIRSDYEYSNPEFALMGTINWIQCVSLLSSRNEYSKMHFLISSNSESNVQLTHESENEIFESIFISLHNLSALLVFKENSFSPADIIKSCVTAWYDCLFYAAKAMIISRTNKIPTSIAQLEIAWLELIKNDTLIPEPFNIYIENLTSDNIESTIKEFRKNNSHDLNSSPKDTEQAYGGFCSYLSGTAKYKSEKIRKYILDNDFKSMELNDFRKKQAREYRDNILINEHVSFFSCAHRYHGKVRHRDSIFMAYGKDQNNNLTNMINNLHDVAMRFYQIAATYSAIAVGNKQWDIFIADLDENSRLTIPNDLI
ncbi:TPA: hypothetical protein ACPZAW_003588 [Yersinia enterocolitica]|nr:hypothetical protein [Yersinia enterocolitica]